MTLLSALLNNLNKYAANFLLATIVWQPLLYFYYKAFPFLLNFINWSIKILSWILCIFDVGVTLGYLGYAPSNAIIVHIVLDTIGTRSLIMAEPF